jgi:hypothetical protein
LLPLALCLAYIFLVLHRFYRYSIQAGGWIPRSKAHQRAYGVTLQAMDPELEEEVKKRQRLQTKYGDLQGVRDAFN